MQFWKPKPLFDKNDPKQLSERIYACQVEMGNLSEKIAEEKSWRIDREQEINKLRQRLKTSTTLTATVLTTLFRTAGFATVSPTELALLHIMIEDWKEQNKELMDQCKK